MNAELVARRLHELGFNVVCVTVDKRPYGSWRASERSPEPPRCAENVAVTGNAFADGEYKVVILDVDNPQSPILAQVFGEDWPSELCGKPWSFCVRTGARPKGRVRCEGDLCTVYKDKEMKEAERVVPASSVERGLAIVLRVPSKCFRREFSTIRTSDVELIFNNYQVVWGVHPSGVRYEFVKWDGEKFVPTDTVGAGEIISCEELHRLVDALRGDEDQSKDEKYEPPTSWNKPIANPDKLVSKLKLWWEVVGPDGKHFHDLLAFGVGSLMWRYGIKKEDAMEVWERVFQWALEKGLDDERNIKHHRSVVKYVYEAPPDRRRWGKRKLKEVIYQVLKALYGENIRQELVEAEYDEILTALGVTHRRPEDVADGLCVVVSRVTVIEDIVSEMPTAWICNNQFGITYMTMERKPKKGRRKEEGKEEEENKENNKNKKKEEEEKEYVTVYKESKVCDVHIITSTVYVDVYTGREYVNAVYADRSGTQAVRMLPLDNFVERIERNYKVRHTVEWRILLNYYPHVTDVIYSGFFCPPEEGQFAANVPCKVRDYFDTGIVNAEKPQAREALETTLDFFSRFAPTEELYRTYVTAFAQGLAQTFHLTRKLWGVRPAYVVYEGPRGVGKSTIARLVLYALHPKRATELFAGAYASMSAARIGRLQSDIVASVMVLDEQKVALAKTEVAEVLKSMITSPIAWRTAFGNQWPAYSGVVLTANYLRFDDPDLADKLYKVAFPAGADPARRREFAETLQQVQKIVPYFGGWYLYYAERNWHDVKQAVLAPLQPDAANSYFRIIAEDLGVSLPELIDVTEEQKGTASSVAAELLVRYIWNQLRPQLPNLGQTLPLEDAIERALQNHRIPDIREYGDSNVLIQRSIESELGVNLATLCEELGGELYTKSRNSKYYRGCILDRRRFINIIVGVGDHAQN